MTTRTHDSADGRAGSAHAASPTNAEIASRRRENRS